MMSKQTQQMYSISNMCYVRLECEKFGVNDLDTKITHMATVCYSVHNQNIFKIFDTVIE